MPPQKNERKGPTKREKEWWGWRAASLNQQAASPSPPVGEKTDKSPKKRDTNASSFEAKLEVKGSGNGNERKRPGRSQTPANERRSDPLGLQSS